MPGALRTEQVAVGRHENEPPLWSSLPAFLDSLDVAYSRPLAVDDMLPGIAAAHHRGAWVHPFLDGIGRAVRLQTHCALWPLSAGLWSMSRGLARNDRQAETALRQTLAHAAAVVLLGPRQVGKTTLARHIAANPCPGG